MDNRRDVDVSSGGDSRKDIQDVLSDDDDPAWSKRMRQATAELRGEHTFLSDSPSPPFDHGSHIEWWTFCTAGS